jgi:hypothetical protein
VSRKTFGWLGLTLLAIASAVVAAPPSTSDSSLLARGFWGGIDSLNLLFKAIGTLSGGADAGEIWIVDLRSGQRQRVGARGDMAFPVLAPDGITVFALRGRQLVRVTLPGQGETSVGPEAEWRKLVGVTPKGAALGFVAGTPRAHPALMSPDGRLSTLPQPSTDEERRKVSLLLQENRAYADGRELLVKRSARGGRGFDVYLVSGATERNLSDCGDAACGQPSLSPDGQRVLYIRTMPN